MKKPSIASGREKRRHPRLKVSLPSIYCQGEGCHIAEIQSLSTGGAFIKTGWHKLDMDDHVRIGIPLLGMNRELEIEGRVIYRIEPTEENNYLQGVGVRFASETETAGAVEEYIRSSLDEGHEWDARDMGLPPSALMPSHTNRAPADGRLSLKI